MGPARLEKSIWTGRSVYAVAMIALPHLAGCATIVGIGDVVSYRVDAGLSGASTGLPATSPEGGDGAFPDAGEDAGSSEGGLPVRLPGAGAGVYPGLSGPYTTAGRRVFDRNGNPHLFRGVDRPSLQWSCVGDIKQAEYAVMASWGANVVRLSLNQDCWLNDINNPTYVASYEQTVDQQVAWAEAAGMDVILTLEWSDQGNFAVAQKCFQSGCQQDMADTNSLRFWMQVATKYKSDPAIVFELYSEPSIGKSSPTDADWTTWLSGGISSGYPVVGMQTLVDAVRKVGATNLVIAGGLQWAYDLEGVPTHAIAGKNVMYGAQLAQDKYENTWTESFGFLTATYPVIVTEFGDSGGGQPPKCSGGFDTAILAYMEQTAGDVAPYEMSWTAWAFYNGGCQFQSLILDGNMYTPSGAGLAVQAGLQVFP